MSYQIDYFTALTALFTPIDPVFLLIVAGTLVISLGSIVYTKLKTGNARMPGMIMIAISAVVLTTIFAAPLLSVGSGWQLGENELTIEAMPVTDTIAFSQMKIMLTDPKGPWKPVLRTNGYGTPGLSTGWFKLANGKKAVVFYHTGASKVLIVSAQERYYLIAHPGVERLYNNLIRKGVEKNVL